MPTINFHVITDGAPDAHLRYACRLVEQAFDSGKRAYVRTYSAEESKRLDDLLWTYSDRTFLPHEIAAGPASHERVRILIGEAPPAAGSTDVLINLAADVPTLESLERIDEIVPTDAERKRIARDRFKQYRDRGLQPETRNV